MGCISTLQRNRQTKKALDYCCLLMLPWVHKRLRFFLGKWVEKSTAGVDGCYCRKMHHGSNDTYIFSGFGLGLIISDAIRVRHDKLWQPMKGLMILWAVHTMWRMKFYMDQYCAEADAWNIGVVAYILLCGSRPFWARPEPQNTADELKVPLYISILKLMKAYMRSSDVRKGALQNSSKTLTVDELFYLKEQFSLLEQEKTDP
nr:CDPK-related kinase 5-like [Tanacetum cinerariifolium]